jgi:hypothetical protein
VTSKIDKPAVKDWVMARQVSLPWVRDAALAQQEG